MSTRNPARLLTALLTTVSLNALAVAPVAQEGGAVRIEEQQQAQTQTDAVSREAGEWGLSAEEYARFDTLMKGRRGIQSPGLDPLTALGIEARTDAERRRLAEKWVQQEYLRTEKELAFQREIDAAWKRLYGHVLPVNMGQPAGIAQDSQGKLALFVQLENCGPCDAKLAAILAEKRPVDIYVLGTKGNDERLRAWAKEKNIPVDRVKRREITLNHDAGRSLQYGLTTTPVVLQQKADGSWRTAAF